jgi:hypothetical protein
MEYGVASHVVCGRGLLPGQRRIRPRSSSLAPFFGCLTEQPLLAAGWLEAEELCRHVSERCEAKGRRARRALDVAARRNAFLLPDAEVLASPVPRSVDTAAAEAAMKWVEEERTRMRQVLDLIEAIRASAGAAPRYARPRAPTRGGVRRKRRSQRRRAGLRAAGPEPPPSSDSSRPAAWWTALRGIPRRREDASVFSTERKAHPLGTRSGGPSAGTPTAARGLECPIVRAPRCGANTRTAATRASRGRRPPSARSQHEHEPPNK